MKIDRRELLAVFAGGAVGALARVAIIQLWPSSVTAFPWAVFAINISGTCLLAYLVVHLRWRASIDVPEDGQDALGQQPFPYGRQLIGTGFCGAYTTFSTMQLELLHMVDGHRAGLAGLYVGLSVICGYTAMYATTALTRRVRFGA